MFEAFRCEDCVHGIYNQNDSCWESGMCNAEDEEQCEKFFEEDERT